MEKVENTFLYNMWHIHKTSTTLQAVKLDVCNAVNLVSSLRDYVASLRDDFDNFEGDAKNMSPTMSQHYRADAQRHRKRKKQADVATEPNKEQSVQDLFKAIVFITIIH